MMHLRSCTKIGRPRAKRSKQGKGNVVGIRSGTYWSWLDGAGAPICRAKESDAALPSLRAENVNPVDSLRAE